MPPSAVTYSVIRHTWHAKQISALPQESTGWERGGLVVEEWKTGEVTLGAPRLPAVAGVFVGCGDDVPAH